MKNKIKQMSAIAISCLIIVSLFILVGYLKKDKVEAGVSNKAVNILGSIVGTTTTGVYLTANNGATTTYPSFIGDGIDEAIYTIKAVTASTTAQGPNAYFSILSSNDGDCATASSTPGTMNRVAIRDINWFDASNHIKNAAAITSLSSATGTIGWLGMSTSSGREIILTNLNSQCLAIQATASGTSLMIQLKTKEK